MQSAKYAVVWPFYVVGFGLAALARTNKRRAWPVVAAEVLLLIVVGIFYCIQRLPGVTLAPAA